MAWKEGQKFLISIWNEVHGISVEKSASFQMQFSNFCKCAASCTCMVAVNDAAGGKSVLPNNTHGYLLIRCHLFTWRITLSAQRKFLFGSQMVISHLFITFNATFEMEA